MRVGIWAVAVYGAGCSSSAPSADAIQQPLVTHGAVGLWSGGAEIPALAPSAGAEFPLFARACETDEIVDGCRVRRTCNPVPGVPSFSAGVITFSTTPPTIVPAGSHPYVAASELAADDSISISAEGADIPGFSAALEVPPQATITSRFDQAPLSAGESLTLSWTGANAGVLAARGYSGIDGDFHYIDCVFDAANGSATISRAALDRWGGGLMSLAGYATTTIEAGEWTIDVSIGFDAIWTDLRYAQGVVL